MLALQENDVVLRAKDRGRGVVLRGRRLKPTLLKGANDFATERSRSTSNQAESKNEGENHGEA
jgi:hypothetical protein